MASVGACGGHSMNTVALAFSSPFWEYVSVQRLGTRQLGIFAESNFAQKPEMQWRHTALARGLTFELFRPYCFPDMPGFTVTITHYWESIYKPQEKEAPITRASMRNQTLHGTVAGLTMYHQVLECFWQTGMKTANSEIQDVFRCVISMQIYSFFSARWRIST